MTVHKTMARLLEADGVVMGEGRAYLHLRLPDAEPETAQGTLSLDWWNEASRADQAQLELVDGPTLSLTLESDKLSGCIHGPVLRYKAAWPGAS